jgi:hypothetical protein
MSYLLEPMTEPLTILFDLNGCWQLFLTLGVVVAAVQDGNGRCCAQWKLQSGKYAFSFDLIEKRDSRLRTKLDLHVRNVIGVY